MQVRSARVIAIVVLTTLAISASARAQNIPAGEILGAYQIASWSSAGPVASGWFVSAARNFSDRMSFVFELGRTEHGGTYTSHHEVFVSEHTNRLFRHRDTVTAPPGKHLGTERITKRSSESVSVAGLGVRYRHVAGKAAPFFQVLGGFALGSDKDIPPSPVDPICAVSRCIRYEDVGGGFILQPGLGVDVRVSDRVTLRFQADLLLPGGLGPRFSSGLALGLGSR